MLNQNEQQNDVARITRGGVQGGRGGRTGDMGVLEVEVEFKEEEEEEQVIWGCWRSSWSSRRMNMWF